MRGGGGGRWWSVVVVVGGLTGDDGPGFGLESTGEVPEAVCDLRGAVRRGRHLPAAAEPAAVLHRAGEGAAGVGLQKYLCGVD